MRDLSNRVPIRGRGYNSLASQACGPLSCYMYALVCEPTQEAVAVIDPSFVTPTEFTALQDLLEKKECSSEARIIDTWSSWPCDGRRRNDEYMAGSITTPIHPMEDENYRRSREMGVEFGLRLPGDTPLPTPTHELQEGGVIRIGDNI